MNPAPMPPEVSREVRPDGLSAAIERAEAGSALYVWRIDSDSPWRITDWDGVPDPLDTISDCGRVDLFGVNGLAARVKASPSTSESP